jgi:hypothetical protein
MLTYRKVGGIRFLKLGRLNISVSVSRKAPERSLTFRVQEWLYLHCDIWTFRDRPKPVFFNPHI